MSVSEPRMQRSEVSGRTGRVLRCVRGSDSDIPDQGIRGFATIAAHMQITNEAKEYCIRGIARHAQGDLRGAIADFEVALSKDARCAEAWNNRGAARHALGDLAGALSDLDQAVAIAPRYPEAFNNRGIVQHALGSPTRALAEFDRALEIRPRYAEALNNRGAARHALGDFAGALADLDRAIGIRPNQAEAYLSRAAVLKAVQDWDGAFIDYDHALRLAPPQAAAAVHHLRADVRVNQRRFADALVECNQAIAIDPQFCMACVSRGNVRYHLRDMSGPSDYWTAFQLNPHAAAQEIIRILTTDIRQDVDEVLANCRKHVRICPDDVVAYARRGLTLLLLGRDAEAATDFSQALQRRPEWKDYLDLLVGAARRQRQT